MRYRIRVSEQARSDILEIVDYIARDSVDAALHWYGGILEAIKTLDQHPLRCMLTPNDEVLRVGLRRLLYGKYRVLFAVSEKTKTVDVLHVRHGARLPP